VFYVEKVSSNRQQKTAVARLFWQIEMFETGRAKFGKRQAAMLRISET